MYIHLNAKFKNCSEFFPGCNVYFFVILFYYKFNYLYIVVLYVCGTGCCLFCCLEVERKGKESVQRKYFLFAFLWFYEFSLVAHIVAVFLTMWLRLVRTCLSRVRKTQGSSWMCPTHGTHCSHDFLSSLFRGFNMAIL